jgi:hypothetical protein
MMPPPGDGRGSDGEEEVAQIIPLRRRTGPAGGPHPDEPAPTQPAGPPGDPPASGERSVWDVPAPPPPRRPIPSSVFGFTETTDDDEATETTDAFQTVAAPVPGAAPRTPGPRRRAIAGAAVAAAAVAALVLALGGFFAGPRHTSTRAGSPSSRAVSESAARHTTAPHTAATAGGPHAARGALPHTAHRPTTRSAVKTVHTSPATSSPSGIPAGEPLGTTTPQSTGSPGVPAGHAAPQSSSERNAENQFGFER